MTFSALVPGRLKAHCLSEHSDTRPTCSDISKIILWSLDLLCLRQILDRSRPNLCYCFRWCCSVKNLNLTQLSFILHCDSVYKVCSFLLKLLCGFGFRLVRLSQIASLSLSPFSISLHGALRAGCAPRLGSLTHGGSLIQDAHQNKPVIDGCHGIGSSCC